MNIQSSKTLEDWFLGAPWGSPEAVDFWEYWGAVKAGTRQAGCFMRFGRGIHELAHMVTCLDSGLLDPYWGLEPVGDPYKSPGIPGTIAEIGTTYVEEMIGSWCNVYGYANETGDPTCFDTVMVLVTGSRAERSGKYMLSNQEQERHYQAAVGRFPNMLSIWAELERKRALLRRLIS